MFSLILVLRDELEDLCNQVDMELEKYLNLLKEALGIMKEANKFSYVVSQNNQNVKVILTQLYFQCFIFYSWKHQETPWFFDICRGKEM